VTKIEHKNTILLQSTEDRRLENTSISINLVKMSAAELISTGVLMGIVHVLTGPDHLSAIATLTGSNISHRSGSAFWLGVKWGVGHSFGFILVGGVLIAIEESSSESIGMDERLSRILESFVGVFMIGLGIYSLRKACQHRRSSAVLLIDEPTYHYDDEDEVAVQIVKMPTERRDTVLASMEGVLKEDSEHGTRSLNQSHRSESFLSLSDQQDDVERRILQASESLRKNNDSLTDSQMSLMTMQMGGSVVTTESFASPTASILGFAEAQGKEPPPSAKSLLSMNSGTNSIHQDPVPSDTIELDEHHHCLPNRCCGYSVGNSGILALMAGVVHGVAGPGGVLGVIPAVELKDAKLASIYLTTFCLTSTLVMGIFATSYSTFSEWLAGGRRGQSSSRLFLVEVGSASLSLLVGIVWLVLLSVGQLKILFP